MNDGDVLCFDPNDPECPPNVSFNTPVLFNPANIEDAKQIWRKRAGYPDGLWAGINQPWWSYTGFQVRKTRW